jgi:uncharacterized spore protein YtfJ
MMKETAFNPADISAMAEKSSAAAVESVGRTLERFLEIASVNSVYDSPLQHGDKLIIPAAEVLGVMGFGMGAGMGVGENSGNKDEEGDEGEGEGKPVEGSKSGLGDKIPVGGSGGGGGGHVFTRPVAVIISGPDGVRVEPVVDATKIALAFFTALGFMVGMASRMRRPPRSQG